MPTSDPDCPFCEIVQRDDPDVREIYRDEHVVAFFPLEPAVLGHTLVVPREHMSDIWALDDATARRLAVATTHLSAAMREALSPDGLNIIQSNGNAATQTVFHLHIHIVPRWENDAVGRIWPPETNYSEEQKDDAWERLKAACRGIAPKSGQAIGSTPSGEDIRKHLDFIQAVVTRMSAASSSAKGWLLPVVAATYGYALTKHAESVALLGLLAVVLFMFLDANYLRQEQGYRALYDAVARRTRAAPLFSLDVTDAYDPYPARVSWCQKLGTLLRKWLPGWQVWLSWSIAPFYGLLGLVGLVTFWFAR